jgi:hypothetical protein
MFLQWLAVAFETFEFTESLCRSQKKKPNSNVCVADMNMKPRTLRKSSKNALVRNAAATVCGAQKNRNSSPSGRFGARVMVFSCSNHEAYGRRRPDGYLNCYKKST